MTSEPYHEHEIEVQEMAGERPIAQRNGAVIADRIPPGAIGFLAQQRFIVLASVDRSDSPWASMILGETGFVTSDAEGRHVTIDRTRSVATPIDILWDNLKHDTRVGGLAIELASRRRLRVNGRVTELSSERLVVQVDEAYPNCPKYIQRRHLGDLADGPGEPSELIESTALDDTAFGIVRESDTVFVASLNPEGGLDASHRGGGTGFVLIEDDGVLRIPDFAGNSMFNTLGNIRRHPRAGLVFVDFESSSVLQVTGDAALDFDADDTRGHTGGTGRFWTVQPDRVRRWTLGVKADWEYLDASPFNPKPTDSAVGEG